MKTNGNFLTKLFWVFWCTTTVLTGILTGFMLSHSIMLGRFFSWMVETDRIDLLKQSFSIFREVAQPDPRVIYYIPIYLSLISGIIWVVLAFILKRDRVIALIAGLSSFWVGALFNITSINDAESTVLSGIANDQMTRLFLAINVPVHSIFAMIYGVSLVLLLLVAIKKNWAESPATL